jgi:hypothetical protein
VGFCLSCVGPGYCLFLTYHIITVAVNLDIGVVLHFSAVLVSPLFREPYSTSLSSTLIDKSVVDLRCSFFRVHLPAHFVINVAYPSMGKAVHIVAFETELTVSYTSVTQNGDYKICTSFEILLYHYMFRSNEPPSRG